MKYDIGMKVFGDWEIVAELGEGSFGKVFRLEKNTYKVKASSALKVLTVPRSPAEVEDAIAEGYDERSVTEQFHEVVEKLVDEIAVMAELKSHPNIVSVEDYTVIEHQGSIGWDILIRMELLTSLPAHQRKNPLNEERVRKLAIDICEALVFCHGKKLIHRDIKPGNVFVDFMGHYKLGDFGVARTAEKTISNMSKQGTENYMAPEVYYGREYGPNVDIYSLGMMLYRLMNKNRLPFYPLPPAFPKFSEKEDALLRRLKGEMLPAPCDAGEEFAAVILKACEADPKIRYRTAEEMLVDLQRVTIQGSHSVENREQNSLEEFLKGKQITQELLTEIMSTRKLTPAEMIYLMSLLDSSEGDDDDDISFQKEDDEEDCLNKEDSFDDIDDFNEDSWEETAGTVGVFGGFNKRDFPDNKNTKKKTDVTNDLSEESTDKMRDHTIHHSFHMEEDDEEDVTISVFGENAKVLKNTDVKKSTDKKTVDNKTSDKKLNGQNHANEFADKKVADKKPADKETLNQFALTDDTTERPLADLGLTVRTYNVLNRAGILTIDALCSLTLADVREIEGVGSTTRGEILGALKAHGLQLSTGKSKKQLWKENKSQNVLEYWRVNLPGILRESETVSFENSKRPANKHYFAPAIPDKIRTEAIYHMTEKHVTRFGQVMKVHDGKLESVKAKDVLAVVDLSFEKETPCSRGILVTADAIYLHLGGAGREVVHPVMIPYKDFASGWTGEAGGLLKAKHNILLWTSRQHGTCRYDSIYSNFVDYDGLLKCLKDLAEKEK